MPKRDDFEFDYLFDYFEEDNTNKNEEFEENNNVEKTYFVIDMKSFFASVECAERGLDPFQTNLVVADKTRTENSICLAITPKMKSMGIKNRCRLYEIPKNLDYIIAPPQMRKYIEYSANIYSLYLDYFDKNDIHIYSIDECFIDCTNYLRLYKLSPRELARKIIGEIYTKYHIPATVGIGTNMFLAKIALDLEAKKEKDQIGFLNEELFLEKYSLHTPITDFWQISKGTAERLKKHGILTLKGIREFDEDILYKEFGINAELLIDHAKGIETCTISDIKKYKRKSFSLSSSQILPCDYNFLDAKLVLEEMLEGGVENLIKHHYSTKTLHIFVTYSGYKKTDKCTISMPIRTNLFSKIKPYFEKAYDSEVDRFTPIRQIGFAFSNLLSEENEYYDLFTNLDKVKKEKNLTRKVVDIKEKFGKNSILKATNLKEKSTKRERNNMIGGHRSGDDKK